MPDNGDSGRQPLKNGCERHHSRRRRRHVVIVGGGMAGLVCAHSLLQQSSRSNDHQDVNANDNNQNDVHVTLIEASSQVGGRIQANHEFCPGFPLDIGAEYFVIEPPHAHENKSDEDESPSPDLLTQYIQEFQAMKMWSSTDENNAHGDPNHRPNRTKQNEVKIKKTTLTKQEQPKSQFLSSPLLLPRRTRSSSSSITSKSDHSNGSSTKPLSLRPGRSTSHGSLAAALSTFPQDQHQRSCGQREESESSVLVLNVDQTHKPRQKDNETTVTAEINIAINKNKNAPLPAPRAQQKNQEPVDKTTTTTDGDNEESNRTLPPEQTTTKWQKNNDTKTWAKANKTDEFKMEDASNMPTGTSNDVSCFIQNQDDNINDSLDLNIPVKDSMGAAVLMNHYNVVHPEGDNEDETAEEDSFDDDDGFPVTTGTPVDMDPGLYENIFPTAAYTHSYRPMAIAATSQAPPTTTTTTGNYGMYFVNGKLVPHNDPATVLLLAQTMDRLLMQSNGAKLDEMDPTISMEKAFLLGTPGTKGTSGLAPSLYKLCWASFGNAVGCTDFADLSYSMMSLRQRRQGKQEQNHTYEKNASSSPLMYRLRPPLGLYSVVESLLHLLLHNPRYKDRFTLHLSSPVTKIEILPKQHEQSPALVASSIGNDYRSARTSNSQTKGSARLCVTMNQNKSKPDHELNDKEERLLTADHVVVAVPATVMPRIMPNLLPQDKIEALKYLGYTNTCKVVLKFSESFWPPKLQSIVAGDCLMFPEVSFRSHVVNNEHYHLVVFSLSAEYADDFVSNCQLHDNKDKNSPKDADGRRIRTTPGGWKHWDKDLCVGLCLQHLATVLSVSQDDFKDLFVDVLIHDWNSHAWIECGQLYPRVGLTVDHLDALAAPIVVVNEEELTKLHQRQNEVDDHRPAGGSSIHFCGEATDTNAIFSVQSAMETGRRAAHEVFEQLALEYDDDDLEEERQEVKSRNLNWAFGAPLQERRRGKTVVADKAVRHEEEERQKVKQHNTKGVFEAKQQEPKREKVEAADGKMRHVEKERQAWKPHNTRAAFGATKPEQKRNKVDVGDGEVRHEEELPEVKPQQTKGAFEATQQEQKQEKVEVADEEVRHEEEDERDPNEDGDDGMDKMEMSESPFVFFVGDIDALGASLNFSRSPKQEMKAKVSLNKKDPKRHSNASDEHEELDVPDEEFEEISEEDDDESANENKVDLVKATGDERKVKEGNAGKKDEWEEKGEEESGCTAMVTADDSNSSIHKSVDDADGAAVIELSRLSNQNVELPDIDAMVQGKVYDFGESDEDDSYNDQDHGHVEPCDNLNQYNEENDNSIPTDNRSHSPNNSSNSPLTPTALPQQQHLLTYTPPVSAEDVAALITQQMEVSRALAQQEEIAFSLVRALEHRHLEVTRALMDQEQASLAMIRALQTLSQSNQRRNVGVVLTQNYDNEEAAEVTPLKDEAHQQQLEELRDQVEALTLALEAKIDVIQERDTAIDSLEQQVSQLKQDVHQLNDSLECKATQMQSIQEEMKLMKDMQQRAMTRAEDAQREAEQAKADIRERDATIQLLKLHLQQSSNRNVARPMPARRNSITGFLSPPRSVELKEAKRAREEKVRAMMQKFSLDLPAKKKSTTTTLRDRPQQDFLPPLYTTTAATTSAVTLVNGANNCSNNPPYAASLLEKDFVKRGGETGEESGDSVIGYLTPVSGVMRP